MSKQYDEYLDNHICNVLKGYMFEDLFEVLKWYEEGKDNIKLHPLTRDEVESLLFAIETCVKDQMSF